MKPRPFQLEAAAAVEAAWQTHRRALVVMATGLGKTALAAMLAHRRRDAGRAIFICHREELVWQAVRTFRAVFEDDNAVDVEMGSDYHADRPGLFARKRPVVVASVASLFARDGRRAKKFNPAEFSTVIVDEAHHYIAPAYYRAASHFFAAPGARVLGITATPDRADKLAMGRIFDVCPFTYGIREGISDGWLVPIDQWTGTVSGIDLANVGTVAGDLNAGELEEVMARHANVYAVADQTIGRVGERRTLIFTSGVNHARLMAAVLNDRKPNSARAIFADAPGRPGTAPDERRRILADFGSGKLQYLVNVGICTEGFDDPGIDAIVIARPTKSRALFCQMIGRGTRPLKLTDTASIVDPYDDADDRKCCIAESVKPCCEIIDYVGNAGRHKLITAADILGGDYESEVIQRVKARCTDAEKPGDVGQLLEEERAALAAERRAAADREAERLARLRVAHECEYEQVDPFSRAGFRGHVETSPRPDPARGRRPTEKMLRYLEKCAPKGTDLGRLTMGEAGRLIGEINRRRDNGLCSIDQSKLLASKNLPAEVSRETAKAWIDRIHANNWQVPHDVKAQALATVATQENSFTQGGYAAEIVASPED